MPSRLRHAGAHRAATRSRWVWRSTNPLFLDELNQGPEGRLRVQEGDGGAAASGAWVLVDHAGALALHVFENLVAVVDAVADMVDALAVAFHVLGQGRGVGVGREELDVRVGHLDEGFLHTVALDAFPVGDFGAEHLLVPVDDSVEIADGNSDVVDLGEISSPVIAAHVSEFTES